MLSDFDQKFWSRGEPMVWVCGLALAITLLLTAACLGVIGVHALGTFWQDPLALIELKEGTQLLGEIKEEEEASTTNQQRLQLRVGNRDLYGLDFRWVDTAEIKTISYPEEVMIWERLEYGVFYGSLKALMGPKGVIATQEPLVTLAEMQSTVSQFQEQIDALQPQITKLSYQQEDLIRQKQKLLYQRQPPSNPLLQRLERQRFQTMEQLESRVQEQQVLQQQASQYQVILQDISGREKALPLPEVIRFYYPNQLSITGKIKLYIERVIELLTEEPRESNTEGGLFPAIFGTVMMVFIMSLFSFPLGILAAIYLKEYAKDGLIVRLVRIAVNNLAGIPSIVYGVFGLGFFVYGVGGTIDQLFFPERLPTPTFGTGGILWASLTLALLTVPVVIVSTEEALSSVPQSMREASLALGATKLQTLVRVIIPMASPGILTGFILAMARAAGEVAPLMLTGVVKLAPSLVMDGSFPYIHLERKFMHLGFHIYDVGFQSPNVEAAKPMVFITTFLLVTIVLLMSSVAIYLRNRMKERYTFKSF